MSIWAVLDRLTLNLLVCSLTYSDLHSIIYLEYPFLRCTGTAHLNLFFKIFLTTILCETITYVINI